LFFRRCWQGLGLTLGEFGSGMGGSVGLTALAGTLFFDLFIQAGEECALAGSVFLAIEPGVGFGKIEMHFGAPGIELGSGLKFASGIFPLA